MIYLEKIKKILSAFVATALMCTATVPVFATTQSVERHKLESIYTDACGLFNIPGPQPFYSYTSYLQLRVTTDHAEKVLADANATDEDYVYCYNEIDSALGKMYVARQWAVEEYNLCVEEENINNWYSDEVWQEYQIELEKYKTALDSYDEEQINTEYYAAQKLYTDMCRMYNVVGDVDKSG